VSLDRELAAALAERRAQSRYRQRRVLGSAQGVSVIADGTPLVNFCSNDYLGLANNDHALAAMRRASETFGCGGGASHLVCGHSSEHHALEEELADFTGRDRALLFSTGYMANLGVIQALADRSSVVYEDKLNHASLLDGALLSRAKLQRYRHLGLDQLRQQLSTDSSSRKLIVSDGIFSMDGDAAPLSELAEVAEQHRAWLMVDDAHGFGCIGATGGGLAEMCGMTQDNLPILVGTLGKAFGSFGAFVAGSETLIESLIQFSRTYIYTTSIPPAVAAVSRANLQIIRTESWRREKLMSLVAYFRRACEAENIPIMLSSSPIQPVLIGEEKTALALSEYLREEGFWVGAIRPPTVPEGTSRLRITLCAEHSEAQVEQLVSALAIGWRKLGSIARDGSN